MAHTFELLSFWHHIAIQQSLQMRYYVTLYLKGLFTKGTPLLHTWKKWKWEAGCPDKSQCPRLGLSYKFFILQNHSPYWLIAIKAILSIEWGNCHSNLKSICLSICECLSGNLMFSFWKPQSEFYFVLEYIVRHSLLSYGVKNL